MKKLTLSTNTFTYKPIIDAKINLRLYKNKFLINILFDKYFLYVQNFYIYTYRVLSCINIRFIKFISN